MDYSEFTPEYSWRTVILTNKHQPWWACPPPLVRSWPPASLQRLSQYLVQRPRRGNWGHLSAGWCNRTETGLSCRPAEEKWRLLHCSRPWVTFRLRLSDKWFSRLIITFVLWKKQGDHYLVNISHSQNSPYRQNDVFTGICSPWRRPLWFWRRGCCAWRSSSIEASQDSSGYSRTSPGYSRPWPVCSKTPEPACGRDVWVAEVR